DHRPHPGAGGDVRRERDVRAGLVDRPAGTQRGVGPLDVGERVEQVREPGTRGVDREPPVLPVHGNLALIWSESLTTLVRGFDYRQGGRVNIGLLLYIPYRHLENRVMDAIHAAGFDATLPQARLMQRLDADGSRLTDLAETAQVSKQTAGFLVDQLEKAG